MSNVIDSINDRVIELTAVLRGRSSVKKLEAIAEIAKRPDAPDFHDEVLMLAASTMHREVHTAAKKLLWQLSPQSYVEVEREHPFGSL